ncbi:MAG: hypothetical protein K0Q46_2774 [Rhodococcus erythropolis]|nr:hypothetical protein [Rhodococcus erythropolis]
MNGTFLVYDGAGLFRPVLPFGWTNRRRFSSCVPRESCALRQAMTMPPGPQPDHDARVDHSISSRRLDRGHNPLLSGSSAVSVHRGGRATQDYLAAKGLTENGQRGERSGSPPLPRQSRLPSINTAAFHVSQDLRLSIGSPFSNFRSTAKGQPGYFSLQQYRYT